VRSLDIAAPARVAGVSLPWHPLSDSATWVVHLLADRGGTPAAKALLEARVTADTPHAAWMALRWPAQDLQAGRYWLRFALAAGAGLWLGDAAAVDGWTESALAPPAPRAELGCAPALELLATSGDGASSTAPVLSVRLGVADLAVSIAAAESPARPRVLADLDVAEGSSLDTANLAVGCSQVLSLKLESVRVRRAL